MAGDMNLDTLNGLTLSAIAVPHDNTRRVVLADAADENADHTVAKALRDNKRGPAALKATWQIAQERGVEPEYRLLWAVITTGLDTPAKKTAVAPTPAPAAPAQSIDDIQEWIRRAAGTDGNRRWTRRTTRVVGPTVAPLAPLTTGDDDFDGLPGYVHREIRSSADELTQAARTIMNDAREMLVAGGASRRRK